MIKYPEIQIEESFRAGDVLLGGDGGRRTSYRDKENQWQKRKDEFIDVEGFYTTVSTIWLSFSYSVQLVRF